MIPPKVKKIINTNKQFVSGVFNHTHTRTCPYCVRTVYIYIYPISHYRDLFKDKIKALKLNPREIQCLSLFQIVCN